MSPSVYFSDLILILPFLFAKNIYFLNISRARSSPNVNSYVNPPLTLRMQLFCSPPLNHTLSTSSVSILVYTSISMNDSCAVSYIFSFKRKYSLLFSRSSGNILFHASGLFFFIQSSLSSSLYSIHLSKLMSII